MDILYQVHYNNRMNYIDEIYRHMCFKTSSMITFYVCFVIVVILNLLNLVLTENLNYATLLTIPVFAYVFAVVFFRYKKSIKMHEDRQKEINGDKVIEIFVTATEENVYMAESTGRAMKISYSDINRVFETQNTVVLHSKSNLLYIFPKAAFTVGNAPDFLMFLKNKGIKGAK